MEIMKLYEVSLLVLAIIIGFGIMWGALSMSIRESDMTPQQARESKKNLQMMKEHHDENCRHKKARES